MASNTYSFSWQFWFGAIGTLATILAILGLLANLSYNAGRLTTTVDSQALTIAEIQEDVRDIRNRLMSKVTSR